MVYGEHWTPDSWNLTREDDGVALALDEMASKVLKNDGGSNPTQYGLPEGATELQDLIEYRNMNFATGNIFKAAYRLGHCEHSDAKRDLNKIIWFAQRELERLNEN